MMVIGITFIGTKLIVSFVGGVIEGGVLEVAHFITQILNYLANIDLVLGLYNFLFSFGDCVAGSGFGAVMVFSCMAIYEEFFISDSMLDLWGIFEIKGRGLKSTSKDPMWCEGSVTILRRKQPEPVQKTLVLNEVWMRSGSSNRRANSVEKFLKKHRPGSNVQGIRKTKTSRGSMVKISALIIGDLRLSERCKVVALGLLATNPVVHIKVCHTGLPGRAVQQINYFKGSTNTNIAEIKNNAIVVQIPRF